MADPTTNPPGASETNADGLSALERAAKIGLGPMSPLGQHAWHGDSKPCVSCGELVRLTADVCSYCSQDLSVAMLVRMQQHSGPWYVLEHVRPFPGVSMERLIRQANRGIVTTTTIVRGPHTDHQWRFAAQTPELCKYVGACWNCQGAASESDTYCHHCAVNLDRPLGEVAQSPPATHTLSELDLLSDAIRTKGGRSKPIPSSRGIPAWLIVAAFLLFAIALLLIAINSRGNNTKPKQASPVSTQTIDSVEEIDTPDELPSSESETTTQP